MKKAALALATLGILLSVSTVFAESATTTSTSKGLRGKQVACEARQDSVKKRSDQLTKRAQNMEDVFAKIVQRVEDYYTTKVVPSGKTVANYNDLVAAIATKKAAVDTALADAQAKASAFDCSDLTKMKAQVTDFRLSMQKVISALKDYRTSVRNLIVAVKSVVGATNREASPAGAAK